MYDNNCWLLSRFRTHHTHHMWGTRGAAWCDRKENCRFSNFKISAFLIFGSASPYSYHVHIKSFVLRCAAATVVIYWYSRNYLNFVCNFGVKNMKNDYCRYFQQRVSGGRSENLDGHKTACVCRWYWRWDEFFWVFPCCCEGKLGLRGRLACQSW